ncbi:MAG: DUF1552 domain-containing protein [Planctomycetes bacterium]|nr:DUF1552 domain-containing protein [Planctomycetota bacterium]
MNTHAKQISRRTILRGLGVSLSLPWLEAMGPLTAWAENAAPKSIAPNRMAFLYVPNGVNMADWIPNKEGVEFELSPILAPLANVKDKLLVLTGLTADKARPHGDGGGGHARALAAFLTGVHPHKTDGTDIRAGISVDQAAAARIGEKTRLASLEIGTEQGAMAGNCDSGYSCVYSSTMAWRSATQPLPKEVNPKIVFERMFGSAADPMKAKRDARRKSILDYVREDSKSLGNRLAVNDVRKLDEYFAAIRDIELRIERADKLPPVKTPDYPAPASIPAVYEEHIRLMCDLMVLAFQADVTRVMTFVLANEASNKPYPFIQVPEGHHDLSHHGGDAAKQTKLRKINLFHTKQLAYLLERLKQTKEGDGTLLDHSMIAYGSGIQDGNAHNHEDLPILLAGGGCGTISSGRHIRLAKETPLNNLWLSMLNRMDITVEKLGDSTGTLPSLFDPNAKAAPTPMAATGPKPIMCKTGDLLLEHSFSNGAYSKDWNRITGKFEVAGGQLKCSELPGDMHHSELSTKGPFKTQDFVIQFSFKLDGAKMLAIGLENPKGHVARAIATPEGFEITRWGGKKEIRKINLADGAWHNALIEVHGSEMVAQFDDQPALYIEDEGLKVEKSRLVLINYGQFAWFDDVKIWKAELDEAWAAKRAKLKASGGK